MQHLTEYLPMVTLSRLVTCHCIAASVTHVTRGHGAAPEVTIRGPRGQGASTARTSSQLPVRGGPGHNVTNSQDLLVVRILLRVLIKINVDNVCQGQVISGQCCSLQYCPPCNVTGPPCRVQTAVCPGRSPGRSPEPETPGGEQRAGRGHGDGYTEFDADTNLIGSIPQPFCCHFPCCLDFCNLRQIL